MRLFEFVLLVCMLGLNPAVSAQSNSEGTSAEVMGVYFSPSSNPAHAIVQTIDASQHEVLVQAFGFTHQGIAQALVRAHRRGVAVRVLLDQKSQTTNQLVQALLADAQVALRLDGKHALAHNKVMVIDQRLVITGSFNFTNAAATRNAENLLILRSEALADRYRQEWQAHWLHSAE